MGLINLETDLTSLKFGKDRLGGGDSGQPFIKNPIIKEPGKLANTGGDFILRGGLRAPVRALEDVARLSKYLFNTKSPNGLLFIAKQNLLSRAAVKTESSSGIAYAGGALNEGIYTPLSTLAQAGVGFLGVHLNKQGIDPTGFIPGLSLRTYSEAIDTQLFADKIGTRGIEKSTNRLITTLLRQQNKKNISDVILSYGGGPGSILGIGKTKIKFADKRTGINSPNYKNNFRGGGNTIAYNLEKIFIGDRGNFTTSVLYSDILPGINKDDLLGVDFFDKYNGKSFLPQDSNKIYKEGTLELNTNLPSQKVKGGEVTEDFRRNLDIDKTKTFSSLAPSYNPNNKQNIENRVNLGNPGTRGDISDYVEGKRSLIEKDKDGVEFKLLGPLDKINASPISDTGRGEHLNDLVKFRIGIIIPESGTPTKYVNFRAFIDKFSENYKAGWKGQSYMGRAEEFYKYNSFKRSINIDFTVAVQSKKELTPIYKKLNFLASSLAPTYTNSGYMAGNMSKITLGGYLYEQPGILESVDFSIPDESPWEIGIDTTGKPDKSVKELPLIIKVSLSFTPIHDFIPEFNKTGEDKQRFISLSSGKNENDILYNKL